MDSFDTPDDKGEQPSPVEQSSPPPSHIGRYKICRVLGKGGFGVVYLGDDETLDRRVAIKVPHARLVIKLRDAQVYLNEARTVARLNHPHIVPVYDVGSSEEFPFFVVSKYIDGVDLATWQGMSRFLPQESARLIATVAEALHYAHTQGLVHRDIKPGNILLDSRQEPFVADFGLALREKDVGKGPRYAGTPAYMSPEQARGEGHRVDGRSDIFSLGLVLYELLTGKRPFRGDSKDELLDQIVNVDARPPRQIDDTIPKELDRICLKALAKRAQERYPTAKDLAEDLRLFLAEQTEDKRAMPERISTVPVVPMQTPGPEVVVAAPTSQTPAIIPKGLRSFDARDADFFLELLPGPRDREGVPESIRFWKNRIEETDGDNTFAVGLIYGPSGCGKSSLVKAGLLPRLSADVLTVYVEATAGETETRLLNGLRKRSLFTLPKAGLKETVASLRRGEGLPPGKKVLIVLDQFEQWLHANKQFSNSELLRALRHCDGARVQCLILVRDDFWLAVCRFMRDLEVDLVPGRNVALVDLFDLDHAHKVLAAFGRAFGKLPEMPGRDSGHDHKEFVQQAVAGLALEDVVIPVRLALFAEMMKNRAWTPAALKAVGGAQGVGVTFLEETFSAAGANPRHRLHQKAARAVLKALLPETGTNIKGNMRSKTELLKRSGYQGRPDDFNDLLRVLDQDTRLITPTDPEGGDAESEGPVDQGEEYYQLTHDYLVRSLREWLTKKQKETRSGRAELLLSERAALWSGTGERRHLPSLDEWARIRTFSSSRNWTPLQRRMVRSADRYYLRLGLALFLVLALVGWGSWTYLERLQARSEVDRLLSADVLEVPSVVKSLVARRDQVDPLLREKLLEETDPRRRLFLRLALVQWDPTQSELLMDQLLQAAAQDFSVIRKLIAPARTIVVPRLWTVWEQPGDARRRFRAVCCLADFTPEDPRWQAAGPFVVGELMAENPLTLKYWLDALQPIGTHLLPALGSALADDQWTASERRTLLELYRALATQAATPLQPLEDRLQAKLAESGVRQSRAAAHLAAVIAALGRPERVWPMLAQAPDPTLRSFLIEGLAGIGLDSQLVKQRLSVESDPGIRRALVLLLGTMPHVAPEVEQELLKLYETDPDPGIHFAARWALCRAGEHPHVQALDRRLTTGKVIGNRRWYLSTQGPSFSLIPRPVAPAAAKTNGALSMGLMAVASTEVTVEQFRLFASTHPAVAEETSQALAKLPVVKVTWHDAAAYCNWLSDKDGLPRFYELTDQLYTFPKDGVRDSERIGYRLPTEEEWESACRAGSTSSCSFGEPVAELASHYAWWYDNSRLVGGRSAVGRLKPNDCGLFDMHGNVGEWCLQVSRRRQIEVSGDTIGVARGENMQVQLSNLFSDARSYELMPQKSHRKWIGFRVVRTVK